MTDPADAVTLIAARVPELDEAELAVIESRACRRYPAHVDARRSARRDRGA